MPRPKAAMTIIVRHEENGFKKSDIIKVYKRKDLVTFKTNKKWFNKKKRITPSKMGELIGTFVEKKIKNKV